MVPKLYPIIAMLAAALPAFAQAPVQDASAAHSRSVQETEKGRHVVENVELATSMAGYTVRYEYLAREHDPKRIGFPKWAPTKGYVPVGIAGPSMANWYNQGFFQWTFDGFNINDYKARFRVVREYGQDAMAEYVWDTPKVKATVRFAVTARSDKLLFLGEYEPKQEIKEVKLRLMAYPGGFEKPWNRRMTSQVRTLEQGTAEIDLEHERWLLFEDVEPGRPGAGSAGLLLGDASAYQSVNVSGIGGYAEYTDIVLNPGARRFVLGLYECPSMPGYEQTRDYFRRMGDAESGALAALADADWDQPLNPLPVDEQRLARVRAQDEESLDRPAERWRANPAPLAFPWAAKLPGGPVRAGLLVPRWSAYDTMELARRLDLDVGHQYFDKPDAIVNARTWHYRGRTGIGPLNTSLAMRNAARVCTAPDREVIVVGTLKQGAFGPRLRKAVLAQVEAGKGLVLTGGADVLSGWPGELTAHEDAELAERLLTYLPWDQVPSLRDGGRGRLGEGPPLKAYRYGEGRVLVFRANIARYGALLPLSDATHGLDGADDRLLAMHGLIWAAAAGKALPARIAFPQPPDSIQAGVPGEIPVDLSGATFARVLVRVQDDTDKVHALDDGLFDPRRGVVKVPPLPAMHRYYLGAVALDSAGACTALGGTVFEVTPRYRIENLALTPSTRTHALAPPKVGLPDGGSLTLSASIVPAPETDGLRLVCQVYDCLGRLTARSEAPASGDTEIALRFPRPVVVPHHAEVTLISGTTPLASARLPFTAKAPFPYDDFTVLMWSYAGGDLTLRTENRRCYTMGSDMMDLCHMGGYSDAGAAREYAVAAASGQRMVPYVTRIAGTSHEDHTLSPGLFNERWLEGQRESLATTCRQAAPYAPPAYTLGDENYLARDRYEVDLSPDNVAAFNKWLRVRYPDIGALNAAWKTSYASFQELGAPMLLEDAAQQTDSFAPWFDFRMFMDTAFAELHEKLAGFVRAEDPGAKVGWDGLLRYHWLAGYDFYKLTRNLELNQVYTSHPVQGELVRSFKPTGALTGEWGNNIADNEAGFSAIHWHNLFRGHNSCWWWTSWGCDYIPFNPDMSASHMGRWFFDSAAEVKAGPGKLLLHGRRDHSGIAVLYNQADLFAAKLHEAMPHESPAPSWRANLMGVIHALEDAGCQYEFVAAAEIETGTNALDEYRVLVLPMAVCMSGALAGRIHDFAHGGGVVIADGRAGLLTGNGGIQDKRPLESVFGVALPAGLEPFRNVPAGVALELGGDTIQTAPLETGFALNGGETSIEEDGTPYFVTNACGSGHGVLLNLPFSAFTGLRNDARERLLLEPLSNCLALAGVTPYARLRMEGGQRARCVEQTLFVDGPLRYLCLQQDIILRGIDDQPVTVEIDEPAYVYDLRAGRLVSDTPVKTWHATISRGHPLVFALMPYRAAGVTADVPATAVRGERIDLTAVVSAQDAAPAYHVVHVDVFAPGADSPHREYSQNIACPKGRGTASIPFALNDPAGEWRLVFRDTASGRQAARTMNLKSG